MPFTPRGIWSRTPATARISSEEKPVKSNSSYRAGRRAEMIIRAKARRKAALIHERASNRQAPKKWTWERAVPRPS